jgi:hypothetical protein
VPHVRQQIRDKIFSLVEGLATTGNRVYKSRLYPLRDENLPGLCVSTGVEENGNDEEENVETVQHRNLEIVIDARAKIVAGLDDLLDTILAEVETAVFADRFLGGLVASLDLESVEPELSGEQDKPVGSLLIIFKVQYLTQEGAPKIAL